MNHYQSAWCLVDNWGIWPYVVPNHLEVWPCYISRIQLMISKAHVKYLGYSFNSYPSVSFALISHGIMLNWSAWYMHLVSLALYVDMIWTSITCLLQLTILAICLWSQSLECTVEHCAIYSGSSLPGTHVTL